MLSLLERLPPECYIVIPERPIGQRIGMVRRGQHGVYDTTWDTNPQVSVDALEHVVAYLNRKLNVADEDAKLLAHGSMFGFENAGFERALVRRFQATQQD